MTGYARDRFPVWQEDGADEWMPYSACLGADADLFFPARGEDTRRAKAICAGCVVRRECLDYAITHHEKFGIWGGLSGRERSRVRRDRAASAGLFVRTAG